MSSSKKAVHFGAGNIGRGFIAPQLTASGFEVVFADVVDGLISSLQKSKSYKVIEVGADGEHANDITNYRAINSKTSEADVVKEISTADLVTCAVGPNILKFIAPVIAKGIDARDQSHKPLAVIACENAIGATDTLAEFIKDEKNTPQSRLASIGDRVNFANSAIDRIVPGQDPNAGLDVKLETFFEWVVDQTPFKKNGHPDISSIKWVDDLRPYIERKLFTVNTGHACSAYAGYHYKKKTVYEALQDKKIHDLVEETLKETSDLLVKKHGVPAQEQADYVQKIIKRISNPHLEDIVERVGRAPIRKLGRKERFIGPASEIAEMGGKVDGLLQCIEFTLGFQNVEGDDESAQLAKILKEKSAKDATTELTGLQPDHPLFSKVEAIVQKVQSK